MSASVCRPGGPGQPVSAQERPFDAPRGKEHRGVSHRVGGNAHERLTTAYARLQAQWYQKIGTRRLSQDAWVSESRAGLLLVHTGSTRGIHLITCATGKRRTSECSRSSPPN